ncbi:MAG: SDR family oxidoreductase [Brevundimonas sp.]|uniref:SDR family oxidoreductase n=1 Tax=Brevundimonas sp. TaxID=1871086 RepID=UPI003918FB9E
MTQTLIPDAAPARDGDPWSLDGEGSALRPRRAQRLPRQKPLGEQSIVITGATSGIGLATARRAARAGARVFLIARSEEALRNLCDSLQAEGCRAAYAVADVSERALLEAAAERCVRLFGGIDTWINNAGVTIYGPIRDTTLEDQRRLFETNYWGTVNGSLVAVERMREQPGGGTLINVGSILSDAAIPVQGVYSASKHAVKGFTNALRMELIRERAPVRVSLIKPAAVDTPYKDHARNLTGDPMRNPPPVYSVNVVAEAILHCADHPVREITVGGGGRLLASFHALAPGIAEPLMARLVPALHRDRRNSQRITDDGLFDPTEDDLFESSDYGHVRQVSWLAQARMHPGITAGTLVGAGVALALALIIMLSQRSGPTRLERIGRRMDPRRWHLPPVRLPAFSLPDIDLSGMDLKARGQRLRRHLPDLGAVPGLSGGRSGARRWLERTREAMPVEQMRDQARKAGRFARDHASEGATLVALASLLGVLAVAASQKLPDPDMGRPHRRKGLSRFS